MPGHDYNATVVQRIEISPGMIILRVVPDGPLYPFKAGQYTVLGLRRSAPRMPHADLKETAEGPDRLIRRAYSIASSSRADEYAEFYISYVSSGELSPRLFRLELKDRLFLGPRATGLFTLGRVPRDLHVLLVGTGTGLAPYMSMLRSELVCGGSRRFIVLHGARCSWDLGYRNELVSLSRHCSNMIYFPAVSRPGEDPTWRGLTGYLQDLLASGVIEERTGLEVSPDSFHVFLCGNPGMIEASRSTLISRGFLPDRQRVAGNLHTEKYW